MIVFVKIMQKALSSEVKGLTDSQNIFSVLCTPGYIKEMTGPLDSCNFFPSDIIKFPVFPC